MLGCATVGADRRVFSEFTFRAVVLWRRRLGAGIRALGLRAACRNGRLEIGIRLRQMGQRPRSQAGSGPRAGHHGGVRACRREHYPDSSDSLQRSALYARVSATNPILVTMTSLRILKPLLPALHENTE